ncbi:MAG: hypothetical protein ACI87N_001273 [Flavobacteriales bacterium]|jgi:hypothetical protein
MKKIHFILIVLLGLFLMPSQAMACGNHSGISSCGMEMTSKTKMKDCCKKESHSKSKKEKGCTGKCGQGICGSSSSYTAINFAEIFQIQQTVFNFNTEKQTIDPTVSFLSDGYASIWLIPKIG